jgi:hypothetical protein
MYTHYVFLAALSILLVVSCISIYFWYESRKRTPSQPEKCSGIKCQRVARNPAPSPVPGPGSRLMGADPTPTFDWIVSWTPPSTGTGDGYTVTYSGNITDNTGKQVFDFNGVPQPNFILPGSFTPGEYTVTVTATNQIGQGPAYSQKITITSHQPYITKNEISYDPNIPSLIVVIATGGFPDWNGAQVPPNYRVSSYGVYDSEGRELPTWLQNFTAGMGADKGTVRLYFVPTQQGGDWPFQKGDTFTVKYNIYNYQLSTYPQSVSYTISGDKPGQSSNISPKFNPS